MMIKIYNDRRNIVIAGCFLWPLFSVLFINGFNQFFLSIGYDEAQGLFIIPCLGALALAIHSLINAKKCANQDNIANALLILKRPLILFWVLATLPVLTMAAMEGSVIGYFIALIFLIFGLIIWKRR